MMKGEATMEGLRAALESARARLSKASKMRDALSRAAAEAQAVVAKAEAARRALVTAHADAAAGTPVAAGQLDALRGELSAAERDYGIRGDVHAELALRLEAFEPQLQAAESEFARALASESEAVGADVMAEARRLLAPRLRLAAELIHAGASGPALAGVVSLSSALGIGLDHDPASPEGKMADELRASRAALTSALEEIRESARARRNAAELARRGRGRDAA